MKKNKMGIKKKGLQKKKKKGLQVARAKLMPMGQIGEAWGGVIWFVT